MNDTISARIRRIITGTASSIVAKIEGLAPEMVLDQAILEVDDAIDTVRAELGRVTAQKHHITKAMARLNQEHAKLDEQLRVAHGQGRNDLVETALGRQVDIEDQLPTLEIQLGALSAEEGELNQSITGLVAKRNEMEDELFHFKQAQAQATAAAAPNAKGGAGAEAVFDRADRAFTRIIEQNTGVRRSSLQSSKADSARLVELANLNRRAKIEAKLQALKDETAN